MVGDDARVGPTGAPKSRFATTDGNAARAARAGRTAAGEGRRSAAARRSGVVAFLGGGDVGGDLTAAAAARATDATPVSGLPGSSVMVTPPFLRASALDAAARARARSTPRQEHRRRGESQQRPPGEPGGAPRDAQARELHPAVVQQVREPHARLVHRHLRGGSIPGPNATTNGGAVKSATHATSAVTSAGARHTRAASDASHSATHALSVVGGCSHAKVRSNVSHAIATAGARRAVEAAIQPPNLAANRRASRSRTSRRARSEDSVRRVSGLRTPTLLDTPSRTSRSPRASLHSKLAASANMNP